ncbi:hypothetical protein [Saccharopolyspora cebuensis]|uniref:Uncharacterized protein n=1 Tax=Saccharopolyspora cebuensis TaxID=418759 RepID=A0ABV4CQW3_9PSEU
MNHEIWHMALMGLVVSALCPAGCAALLRLFPAAEAWTVPGWCALPLFVVLHAVVAVRSEHHGGAVGHALLVVGALLFWAPVLGTRHRLSDPGRTLYLYTALPLLDLAGVWLVAAGRLAGGLAMIAGMLPMGAIAVVITWRWMCREEQDLGPQEET